MPNDKVLAQKQAEVAEVSELFRTSVCTIVTDYRGLSVAATNDLRKQLREAGIEYKVIKNTLARRASDSVELSELNEHLKGPTAIAFSKTDAVAPAKILHEFSKKNTVLKLKAGIVEGKIVDAAGLKALADLPSREGLLSMLLSVLQAPVRGMALAVKAVAESKEEAAS